MPAIVELASFMMNPPAADHMLRLRGTPDRPGEGRFPLSAAAYPAMNSLPDLPDVFLSHHSP